MEAKSPEIITPTLQPSAKVVNAAWNAFLINLANLLKVKSIITIMVMWAITDGFSKGVVPVAQYIPMATAIMIYYFQKHQSGIPELPKG